MKLSLRLICLVLASFAVNACKGGDKPQEARTAQGEILPGSASDAMLPLDSVRSQPPLAPREETSDKGGKASAGRSGAAEAGNDATEEAAAPGPGAAPQPSIAADPSVQ